MDFIFHLVFIKFGYNNCDVTLKINMQEDVT